MNERLLAGLRQLLALWNALTVARKAALVGAMALVVAGVLAVSFVSSRETWSYLFTDLSAEDASSIAAKLKELKIPYRVDGSGAIQVPEERVHEVRLELAGQGLPRGGGVGFELFDKSHLGVTEFEQRVNLRRALEGELSRTISTIAAVQSARVHIVLPDRSVFATTKDAASASVVLRFRPGRSFTKGEIAGVVHLVASAVPGLAEERVAVVGADGLTLHRPRTDGAAAGGAASGVGDGDTDAERAIAATVEEQARSIVERVVGAGHVEVRVGVELDRATRERSEERYEPSKSALRSEQRSEDHTIPEGAQIAGIPGAASNLPGASGDVAVGGPAAIASAAPSAAPATAAAPSGPARVQWTRNFEIDKVVERTTLPAGKVARLSVAVLVDGVAKGKEVVPRDPAEVERLRELVKGAVGLDPARGDTLQLESVPFARAEPDPAPEVAAAPPAWKRALPIGAAAALLLAVAAVFALRGRGKRAAPAEARALVATSVDAEIAEETRAPALAAGDAEDADPRALALDIAARDPATAAVILREWLNAPASQTAQLSQ